MNNRIPLPEDEYLLKIAKVTYAIQYLEWSMLGDLFSDTLNQRYPSYQLAEKAKAMTRDTSGQICSKLDDLAQATAGDAELSKWLTEGAAALRAVYCRRNRAIHARPCTTPEGKQRLYRWIPEEQLLIDEKFLDELLLEISDNTCNISKARLI